MVACSELAWDPALDTEKVLLMVAHSEFAKDSAMASLMEANLDIVRDLELAGLMGDSLES